MAADPPIRFFTEERVCRLTGLSRAQLRYWSTTEFFKPEYESADEEPRLALYSFGDLVSLRAIAALRARVPLQELRRVGAYLAKYEESAWSSLRFTTIGRKVYFFDPDAGCWIGVPEGQVVMREVIAMDRVVEEMMQAVEQMKQRPHDRIGRISRNRRILRNAPVIDGTRIPTAAIFSFHEEGYSAKDILKQYPTLVEKDVLAAIEYERKERTRKQKKTA